MTHINFIRCFLSSGLVIFVHQIYHILMLLMILNYFYNIFTNLSPAEDFNSENDILYTQVFIN